MKMTHARFFTITSSYTGKFRGVPFFPRVHFNNDELKSFVEHCITEAAKPEVKEEVSPIKVRMGQKISELRNNVGSGSFRNIKSGIAVAPTNNRVIQSFSDLEKANLDECSLEQTKDFINELCEKHIKPGKRIIDAVGEVMNLQDIKHDSVVGRGEKFTSAEAEILMSVGYNQCLQVVVKILQKAIDEK